MQNVRLRIPGGTYVAPQSNNKFPSIYGSQTKETSKWIGDGDTINKLYDGLTILYWLPFNSGANATLNITLANGDETGEVPCYFKGSVRLGSQCVAGDVLLLTYRENNIINGESYTGWWMETDYSDNDSDNNGGDGGSEAISTSFNNEVYCKANITSGCLLVGNSSGYQNLQESAGFSIDYPILYHKGDILGGSTTNAADTFYLGLVNPTNTFADASLAVRSFVYIKGNITDKSTFVPYKAELLTTTLPNVEDNFYYMLVGYVGNNVANMTLLPDHPVYRYINGGISQYLNSVVESAVQATRDSENNVIATTYAKVESPAFSGIPTAPTAPKGDKSTQIATTAFVSAALEDIKLEGSEVTLNSPAFTGIPTAPTAESGTNTTQIATTAFVQNELSKISEIGTYVLPKATSEVLGGVFIGNNISVDNGTISLTKENVVSALGYDPVDEKVAISTDKSSKAFITGTVSSDTTGTLVVDTNVYLDTTEGQLVAKTFKGNLVGTAELATKALQDINGNEIVDTYATKEEIPVSLSQLTNDMDFITSSSSISGNAATATKAEMATKALQDAEGNPITETYATKESPVFTGTPTAPTALKGTNNDQIATTAFVTAALEEFGVNGFNKTVDWKDILNIPEVFKPEEHIHNASSIEGLHIIATSGNYNDLEKVPMALSEFENDTEFVTKDAFNVANETTDGLMSAIDKVKLDKMSSITAGTEEDIDSLFS